MSAEEYTALASVTRACIICEQQVKVFYITLSTFCPPLNYSH